MKRGIKLSAILILCLILNVNAQTWRSKLYPDNWQPPSTSDFYRDMLIQDFSYAGYHRGEKEIPVKKQIMLDVTKPPYNADHTGKQNVTAILQKAIDDAGRLKQGGIVYLPKGTYKVSPLGDNDYCLRIEHSYVVLSGSGPGQTFIYNSSANMRSKAIITIRSGTSWAKTGENKKQIMKDLMGPTTIIPVQSTSGFKAGDLIIVRNYIDNNWIEKHKMLQYWKGKGDDLGGLLYCREIMAVNHQTNELTIDIPIRYALETMHGACVYKAPPMLMEVGVENLSVGNQQSLIKGGWSEEDYHQDSNGSYQCHNSWAIAMSQVNNGWIRQVTSYHPEGNTSDAHLLSNGIKVSQTKNVSILNCTFGYPQFGGGGGNGYMYRIMSNETLLQDCIADFNRHGFVMSQMAASGNVFFRCTDRNSGSQTGLQRYQKTNGSGSDHHMHFSQSNLFDQCLVENSYFAAGWRKWGGSTIHGLTATHSVYWNLTSNGSQAEAVQTQQSGYGYVIGTAGNKPDIKTSAWAPGTEVITDPVDYMEGIGQGNKLSPQSLYLDQKNKRLASHKK